jgi:hypothetical protein
VGAMVGDGRRLATSGVGILSTSGKSNDHTFLRFRIGLCWNHSPRIWWDPHSLEHFLRMRRGEVLEMVLGLGQVPPHFLHHPTESRADLPDLITSQKCYSLFNDLHIPIPVYHLPFQSTTSGLGGQCGRIISFGKP